MAGLRRQSGPDLGEAEKRPSPRAVSSRRISSASTTSRRRARRASGCARSIMSPPSCSASTSSAPPPCWSRPAIRPTPRSRSPRRWAALSPWISGSGPGCANGRFPASRRTPRSAAPLSTACRLCALVRRRLRRGARHDPPQLVRHRRRLRRARAADRLPFLSRSGGDRLRRRHRQILLPVARPAYGAATAAALGLLLVVLSLKGSADRILQLQRRIVDRLARAKGDPLHRGVRAGRPRLVLGDDRARHPFLRLRAARRRSQDPRRRPDRHAVRRPDRPRRPARHRILGAHIGLPPFDAAALHRHQRARQHRRRNLVVAVGHAELRRIWPLPGLSRHRHRSHPAAPLRGGDQPPRQI